MENLIAGGLILLLGLVVGATIASLAYRSKSEEPVRIINDGRGNIFEEKGREVLKPKTYESEIPSPNVLRREVGLPPVGGSERWVARSFHDTQIARREGEIEALEKDLQKKKAQIRNQAEMIQTREAVIRQKTSRIEELRQGQSDQAQIISDLNRALDAAPKYDGSVMALKDAEIESLKATLRVVRAARNDWQKESLRLEREAGDTPKVIDDDTVMHKGVRYRRLCRAEVQDITNPEQIKELGFDAIWVRTSCILDADHKGKHRDYYGKGSKNDAPQ